MNSHTVNCAVPDLKHLSLERVVDDVKVTANVAPCSWMYPRYGLQVMLRLPSGAVASVHRKSIPFDKATEADVRSTLDSVTLDKCRLCGQPAFAPAFLHVDRDGQCEACFAAKIRAEYSASEEEAAKALAAQDAEMKGRGYTHRVEAFIHPANGGDDYPLRVYMSEPTEAEVRTHLQRQGSCDTDDYRLVPLQ
jgi:hypothetical protein